MVPTKFGPFRMVDRLKELIKYKGCQVAPAEREAPYWPIPGVQEFITAPRIGTTMCWQDPPTQRGGLAVVPRMISFGSTE